MRRTFADLHLRIDVQNQTVATQIIRYVASLGYNLVAVPLKPELATINTETALLKRICDEAKVGFASRVDLKPRTPNELLSMLRRLRRKVEVICVLCENKEVARQAAKDRRVDLLNFPSPDYRRRFFDYAEAELASKSLAALEIDVKLLLVLEGAQRVRLLSSLRREISVAQNFHVPLVLSSGVSNLMLLRKPRELAALASLFGSTETLALQAVSETPMEIVKRNREKLNSKFIAPGIRIVKEGKDC